MAGLPDSCLPNSEATDKLAGLVERAKARQACLSWLHGTVCALHLLCHQVAKPFPFVDVLLFKPSWARDSENSSLLEEETGGSELEKFARALSGAASDTVCVAWFLSHQIIHAFLCCCMLARPRRQRGLTQCSGSPPSKTFRKPRTLAGCAGWLGLGIVFAL